MFSRKVLCMSFFHMRNGLLSTSCKTQLRRFSITNSSSGSVLCEPLKQRCLLKVSGSDATAYLQSMTTNDVKNINESEMSTSSSLCKPMYSMLLNSHGRVLYDIILCKISDKEYLLECDTTAQPYIIKHLEMYRLRKDVVIKGVDNLHLWVAFSSKADSDAHEETLCSVETIASLQSKESVIAVFRDPRVPQLGCRFIVESTADVKNVVVDIPLNIVHKPAYNVLRYKLGIGEGVMDHPPGNSFPLECNVDYLHGVNFQKGCYIGQELTARIHHTGIVRKRLMPLAITSSQESTDFPAGCTIVNERGLKMGKLCSNIGQHGLALLNVKESLKSEVLTIKGSDIKVKTSRPCWWPQDDQKASVQ